MAHLPGNASDAASSGVKREGLLLLAVLLLAAFLFSYNLSINPRPWHDEGGLLSVSRTLIEDGVYAGRNSDGYQTFGAVQSAGPTVLLPIALSFKVFGIGLLQGRAVIAAYALVTVALVYAVGRVLFGRAAAVLAIILLLGSPAVEFLRMGRQVVGDAPALGFFLAGWLAWWHGMRARRGWLYPLAGLLFGAAMVTKSQYIPMVFGSLALAAVLDLVYYRHKKTGALIVIGAVALLCAGAWWGWQMLYYGQETFQENAEKMRQLAAHTTGFDLQQTVDALKFIVGSQSGHFYYFWGIFSLIYGVSLCMRRRQESLSLAFLLIFSLLWLAYYLFWIIPWPQVVYAPMAICALFVAKLWYDLAKGLRASWPEVRAELRRALAMRRDLNAIGLLGLGTLIALLAAALGAGYQLQSEVRTYVLDQQGRDTSGVRTPGQLQNPYELAALLEETVEPTAVIETWERELGILTDHQYHFPDQSLLAPAWAATSGKGEQDYRLGAEYFEAHRPSYLVVGWFARSTGVYDAAYLAKKADLIATVGDGEWRYDVYRLHLSSLSDTD